VATSSGFALLIRCEQLFPGWQAPVRMIESNQ
jgi:hypothetical protein